MWTDVENEGSRIVGPEPDMLGDHIRKAERSRRLVEGRAARIGEGKGHEGRGGRGSGGGNGGRKAGGEQSTRAKAVGNRARKVVAGILLRPVIVQDGLRWVSSGTEKIHGHGRKNQLTTITPSLDHH